MDINVQPGKYVVAVSGGVDSMVLLDLLRQKPGIDLVVAHFDHGIRPDSAEDAELIERVIKPYGLPYGKSYGKLGPGASEAKAREARYAFLEDMRQRHEARAIITAHHQDDLLETIVINLLRGTNRKGLSSLKSTETVVRPLLHVPKIQLREYAEAHKLKWREDSTNESEQYLRNYIRRQILPRLGEADKANLLRINQRASSFNAELDKELAGLLPSGTDSLGRAQLIKLPHAATRELLAAWLRANRITNFDSKTLERLAVAAKTAMPGSRIDVVQGWRLTINKQELALERVER
jgi:tRNA(Ile)-lysidine synthetase-like protein